LHASYSHKLDQRGPNTGTRAAPFCEGCTWHDLHILVTALFCCNQKAKW